MKQHSPNLLAKVSNSFLFRLFLFIALSVFVFLIEGYAFLGGGYKYTDSFVRVFVPIIVAFYFSFFLPIGAFYSKNVSRNVQIVSLLGAIVISVLLILRFFQDYFENILSGGDRPLLVRKLFSLLHLSKDATSVVAYISCAILFVFSVLAIAVLLGLLLHLLYITIRYTKNNQRNEWTPSKQNKSTRYAIAIILSIISAILCFTKLTKGQDWGADYALYIQQGIKLAKGITTNIHAAWGFSSMLSIIYLLFGYDMVDYHTIIYYKIPCAICFAFLVFFLYLFFSKRFQTFWAIFLTCLFGLNPVLINMTNDIGTDFPHMMFCVVCILCIYELFQRKSLKEQIFFGILIGVLICIANLIRAAGIALLFALLFTQLIYLVSHWLGKDKTKDLNIDMPQPTNVYIQLLPYIVYGLLTWIATLYVPYYPIGKSVGHYASTSVFFKNFSYYFEILFNQFISSFTPYNVFQFLSVWIALPCLIIGIYRSFAKDTVSVIYFCFMFISMLFVWALNGIRYTFPLLPFFVLFLAVGAKTVIQAVSEKYAIKKTLSRIVSFIAICVLLLLSLNSILNSISNMTNGRRMDRFAFSTDAIATYQFIQKEIDEEAIIVFYKTEVVELNTGRVTISSISKDTTQDQYLLITMDPSNEHQYLPDEYASEQALENDLGIQLHLVYENARFQLFQIII